MPWGQCSSCERPYNFHWDESFRCTCGRLIYDERRRDEGYYAIDSLDSRLIHDAVLPEVVGDYETADDV